MIIQTLKFFILFSLLLSCSNPQVIEADTPMDNIVEFVSVPEPTDSIIIENAWRFQILLLNLLLKKTG